MKRFSLIFSLISLLILFTSSIAQAQFDPCFGLAETDCAAINEASANGLDDAESLTLDLSIDFAADNISEEDLTALTFTMDGSIDFAMGDDSEIGLALAGGFDVTYSQNGEAPTEQTIDLVLAGDFLYFNVDDTAWQSIDLIRLLEDEAIGAQLEGLGVDTESGTGDDAMLEDLPLDPMTLLPLLEIVNLPGLLNYERMGDDFVFTVDFSALQALLEEENEELLDNIIEVASEIDPTAAFLIPAIPALIENGTITITQTVNADLNIIDFIGFDVDVEAALLQLTTGDPEAPATSIVLDVDLGVGNLDGVGAIEAPADATDITDMLLGMLGAAVPQ